MTAAVADRTTWDVIDRVQAGDPDAFADLYRTYHGAVLAYVRFRVPNQWTAQDITGDVFVRALAHIDDLTWQGRGPLAWLYTVAGHLVADHRKRASTRLERIFDDMTGIAGVDPGPGPHDIAAQHADQARLHGLMQAAISLLGTDQRQCITLRYLRGASLADTARAMGRTVKAIKSLQQRGERALAHHLAAVPW